MAIIPTDGSPCCMRAIEAEQTLHAVVSEVANVLQQLDQMADMRGDDERFRLIRDRLRKIMHIRTKGEVA